MGERVTSARLKKLIRIWFECRKSQVDKLITQMKIGLKFFKYLGPKFCFSVPDTYKNLKKSY